MINTQRKLFCVSRRISAKFPSSPRNFKRICALEQTFKTNCHQHGSIHRACLFSWGVAAGLRRKPVHSALDDHTSLSANDIAAIMSLLKFDACWVAAALAAQSGNEISMPSRNRLAVDPYCPPPNLPRVEEPCLPVAWKRQLAPSECFAQRAPIGFSMMRRRFGGDRCPPQWKRMGAARRRTP